MLIILSFSYSIIYWRATEDSDNEDESDQSKTKTKTKSKGKAGKKYAFQLRFIAGYLLSD